MARIKQGILGGFSGRVGPVIGTEWRGINVMRSLPLGNRNLSEKQLAQVAKFTIVNNFLKTMRALLTIGFKDFSIGKTGLNCALSYALKNAVSGKFPNLVIEYPLVLVARGDLPVAKEPSALASGTGNIQFNWSDNTGLGKAKASDKAILVAYCPEKNKSVYTTSGAARKAGMGILNVAAFTGKSVQTWMAFISADREEIASSIHTGQHIV